MNKNIYFDRSRKVLFIGPMKAGTTWIHEYLQSRGDVVLPSGVKETFFFDRNFDKGLSWYASHFSSSVVGDPLLVEVAPSYFHNDVVPVRVGETFNDLQVIATLRHPVKRAWSHYLHLRRYGYTSKSLQDAVRDYPQIIEASRYSRCLERWGAVFGAGNVHVLWQEDMIASLDDYADRISTMLGLCVVPLDNYMRTPSNEAAVAPSAAFAALGRKISYFLRDRRLYNIVNLAKKSGLKNIFFGTPGSKSLPILSDEDFAWLHTKLREDYNSLPPQYKHPAVKL